MIDIKASSSPKVSGITSIVSFYIKNEKINQPSAREAVQKKKNDMKYYYIIDEIVFLE